MIRKSRLAVVTSPEQNRHILIFNNSLIYKILFYFLLLVFPINLSISRYNQISVTVRANA